MDAGIIAAGIHLIRYSSIYKSTNEPEDAFLSDFIGRLCEDQGLAPLFETGGEVELSTRAGKDGDVTFVINHGVDTGWINLGTQKYKNLLNDEVLSGTCNIGGRDVLVIRKQGK